MSKKIEAGCASMKTHLGRAGVHGGKPPAKDTRKAMPSPRGNPNEMKSHGNYERFSRGK